MKLDLGTPVTLITERFAPARGNAYYIPVICAAMCGFGRWPGIKDALRGTL